LPNKNKNLRMGIYLSSPDTKKFSVDGSNKKLKYGASAMQGWRLNMEDAHISDSEFGPDMALFAVFDGHGGPEVAKYCERHFGDVLKSNPNFEKGRYDVALKEAFLRMDELLVTTEGQAELRTLKPDGEPLESQAGCTANVCLLVGNTVYCANAGDSRSILYSNKKMVPLSEDHKPENEVERNRINQAGGFIIEGRVNGNLNLSRAIGDLEYKKNPGLKPTEQLISAEPDVVTRVLTGDDEFIVMGCDGVWEILTGLEICQIVERRFRDNPKVKASKVIEEILDRSLAPDTSRKHITFRRLIF
jgi:serine/threonine protein phosphatase PrpC